jgi:hypothetical protein
MARREMPGGVRRSSKTLRPRRVTRYFCTTLASLDSRFAVRNCGKRSCGLHLASEDLKCQAQVFTSWLQDAS